MLTKVPTFLANSGAARQITCFRCREKGHFARNCKKPPRRRESNEIGHTTRSESRQTERSRPTVASIGCTNPELCDYVVLELDVNQGRPLYFLVDSGADISLVKSEKLLGTTEFEPRNRVLVKSVDGSTIEYPW